MPRQARSICEYSHVIVRGVGRQILFEEDADRRYYLSLLQKYGKEQEIVLMAYCLMENHVHLLVYDAAGRLSVFMKKLGVSYSFYFNKKYDRVGHLFQDRFKSEAIATDEYLLTAYRYILKNPEKAEISPAEQYPWSSYREYGTVGGITDTSLLREMIGSETSFVELMHEDDEIECMEADRKRHDDAWGQTVLCKTLSVHSGTELQQWPKDERDRALAQLKKKGISVRQLERLTGINRGVIQKAADVVNENRPL